MSLPSPPPLSTLEIFAASGDSESDGFSEHEVDVSTLVTKKQLDDEPHLLDPHKLGAVAVSNPLFYCSVIESFCQKLSARKQVANIAKAMNFEGKVSSRERSLFDD